MNKNQKGFGIIEIILVIIVVGVLSATGWYAIHTKHQTDKILAQSEKTTQSSPAASMKSGNSASTDNNSKFSPGNLIIQEWGISFQIPSNLKTMNYTNGIPDSSSVSLDSDYLSSLAGSPSSCKQGGAYLGWLFRRNAKDIPEGQGSIFIKQTGSYYYYYTGPQQACQPPSAKSIDSTQYPSTVEQNKAVGQLPDLLKQTLSVST